MTEEIRTEAFLKGFCVVLILIVLMAGCISMFTGASRQSSIESLKSSAIVYCQMTVKDSLKAPRSAEFPWDMTALEVSENGFAVMSYVDAQNSFGAMLRTEFTCEVEHVGDSWRVKKLTTFQR